MPATVEQDDAIGIFLQGYNVLLDAPPGTGKSWTLMEIATRYRSSCEARRGDGAVLTIIAYNTELAAELVQAISDAGLENVHCYTFHGLCTRLVRLTADDAALEMCVEDMESGRAVPTKLVTDGLLIDEAQDMNRLHLRLLRCLLDKEPHVCAVGDPRQRLYDFGAYPSIAMGTGHFEDGITPHGEWIEKQLTLSQRITPAMAGVVRAHFDTALRSAKVGTANDRVHAHLCDKWKLGDLVHSIVRGAADDDGHLIEHEHVCLLAATKAGNAPLRAAVNFLSERGVPLYVQGVDGSSAHVRNGKMRVMSFHASKGTECKLAIVLVAHDVKDNPLYVALTRSKLRLHIVMLSGEAHVGLLDTLRECDSSVLGLHGDFRSEVGKPAVERSKERPSCMYVQVPRNARLMRRVDVRRVDTRCATRDDEEEGGALPEDVIVTHASTGRSEDVTRVYECAARLFAEHSYTSRVRAVEDMLLPPRLEYVKQEAAIRNGHHGRFVGPRVRSDSLLADDCMSLASRAYSDKASPHDWCTMAAAVLAWNGYHHSMRQLLPTSAWVDETVFRAAAGRACEALEASASSSSVRFDVRLKRDILGSLVHARAHAATREGAFHFVWSSECGGAQSSEAAVRALLHPNKTCYVVSLTSDAITRVYADSDDDVISEQLVTDPEMPS